MFSFGENYNHIFKMLCNLSFYQIDKQSPFSGAWFYQYSHLWVCGKYATWVPAVIFLLSFTHSIQYFPVRHLCPYNNTIIDHNIVSRVLQLLYYDEAKILFPWYEYKEVNNGRSKRECVVCPLKSYFSNSPHQHCKQTSLRCGSSRR